MSSFASATSSVSKDKRDTCFSFVEANRGFLFKAAREEVPDREKICVGECEDGREACYKVLGGCDEECPYCVQVRGGGPPCKNAEGAAAYAHIRLR